MANQPAVTVSRAEDGWRADIPTIDRSLGARALNSLFAQLRRLLDINEALIQFRTGDGELDELIRGVQTAQRQAQAATRQVRDLTDRLLSRSDGWSGRDVAVLIGKSHQRVAQLRQKGNTRAGGR